MIEILNSRRMTIVIITLILFCTIVVIVEEWLTATESVEITSQQQQQQQQQHRQKPSVTEKPQSNQNQKPILTDWRSFLTFLGSVGLFGGLSGLMVKFRQQQIRHKSLSRFRSGSESSSAPDQVPLTGWNAY